MPVEERYCVLVNHEEQYSLWRDDVRAPTGWTAVEGMRGKGEEECLGYIEKVWTDMRPASLREAMAGYDAKRRAARESHKTGSTLPPPSETTSTPTRKIQGSATMQKLPKSPWLQEFQSRPTATIRLFCFPFLGGTAEFVKGFPSLMPPNIEVVGIQYPGHGRRMGSEPPLDNLDEFLSQLTEAILPAIKGAPDYAFFGYSMGCFLSYELAAHLTAAYGTWPSKMIMCAQNPKFVVCTDPILDRMTDSEIIAQLTKVGGMPEDLLASEDLMRMMIPLYRADSRLSEQDADDAARWEKMLDEGKQPLVPTQFYAYAGKGEREINRQSLANWARFSSTHDRCGQIRIFEGGHFFIEKVHDLVCQMVARDLLAK
eukprot:Sspe_Gene.115321::Locus_102402_Transcript_1_1_Confidence_1.000_Length_1213::g.115321::m.115321